MEAQERQECTFVPQLINSSGPPRNFEAFLQDQAKHQQRKLNNIARLASARAAQARAQVSAQGRPAIDEKSAALATSKSPTSPVFERLYGLHKRRLSMPDTENPNEAEHPPVGGYGQCVD